MPRAEQVVLERSRKTESKKDRLTEFSSSLEHDIYPRNAFIFRNADNDGFYTSFLGKYVIRVES